jgi:hypothetical protein
MAACRIRLWLTGPRWCKIRANEQIREQARPRNGLYENIPGTKNPRKDGSVDTLRNSPCLHGCKLDPSPRLGLRCRSRQIAQRSVSGHEKFPIRGQHPRDDGK